MPGTLNAAIAMLATCNSAEAYRRAKLVVGSLPRDQQLEAVDFIRAARRRLEAAGMSL